MIHQCCDVCMVLMPRSQQERELELQRELAEVDEMFRSVLAASVASKFLGRFVCFEWTPRTPACLVTPKQQALVGSRMILTKTNNSSQRLFH